MNASRPLAATLIAALVFASTRRAHAESSDTPPPPPAIDYAPSPPPAIVYAPPPPPVVYAPYGYAPAPIAYAPLVPLVLEGDASGMHYEVLGPKGDDRVFGRCTSPCTLQLPAGQYRVRVAGESIPSRQQMVYLEGATRVYSQAGSTSAKNGGLVLAISGTSVAGIGLVVALAATMSAGCGWGDGGCSNSASQKKREDDARSTAGAALVVAGVGALLGTIGWITFAANRTKMSVDGASGPRISFGAAPTIGGASFALTGTF